VAYGDLNSVTVLETADDPEHRTAGDAEIDSDVDDWRTGTSAKGSEFWRYGVDQQQAALGTVNPEADAGVWRENCRQQIMAVLGSTADAS
jgi:hypothetical protein